MISSSSDILDTARKAVGKTSGLSHDAFDADENVRLALTHLVQVVGEAGRRVSPEFSARHPEIPWQEIVGMRHKVVLDYLRVDEDIVWQVVTEDLPPLVVLLEKILATAPGSNR
ncbi:MAG TPA: HepT-like ribonuclease domain-containing protein [Vicinamibacterales bacterium]